MLRGDLDIKLNLGPFLDSLVDLSNLINVEAIDLVVLNQYSEIRVNGQILSNFSKATLVSSNVIEVLHARGQHLVIHYQDIKFKINKQKVLNCSFNQSRVETPNFIELVNINIDGLSFVD